jgi:hypothetical protein
MPFKSKEQERYLQINEPEIYRDWVEKYGHFKAAESFSAERKYQAVDVPLGMVCVLCENDKPATHRIVENGMPFFLCERHWFNYTMGAPNIDVDLSAESFGAEECVSCDTPDGYWRGLPLCSSSGEELCISCCSCNMCRSKWNILEVGEQKAESFNSYKVAPDLSSYTKAELVSSIAGPQGTAAYDEVVYDPLAQSRLSAETATQRFKNYGNSLSGDTVCPACGDESWDEYSDGDEWRGYCGCGYDFDAGSALPNPLLTFYEMEALKEQEKLTSDQKEYLEWRITSTLSDLDSSSHNKKYIQDELVAHGWTLDRWGNAEPPEESVATLVGNAESIDSFSPARLIVLGASIGVALGLYNTRRD